MTGEQLWLKINEPTEKDKGKYAMDIFDGQSGVKRAFDLSGQGGGSRVLADFCETRIPITEGCFGVILVLLAARSLPHT